MWLPTFAAMSEVQKPVIGFTCGDLNGIGLEIIIKTLSDSRLYEMCTPVVFASNRAINFYRKFVPASNTQFQQVRDFDKLNLRSANVFNCWEEEVNITPGQLNETGGRYARMSLMAATEALQKKQIDAMVTAPLHKNNVQHESFNYSGHTPFLKAYFNVPEVVMMLVAENMRVALLSEHVPVKEAAVFVTRQAIMSKTQIMIASLQKDFGISKPRIAVLGLNPHAGDEGLIGEEEESIIKPAVKELRQRGNLVFGPYPADGFFARGHYQRFDAVLAMYHDQGLIPFKSLAIGEGVNYTAGLSVVRTSPDHGTAFDIAGQGKADNSSLLAATYEAIDILNRRSDHAEMRSNPLRRMSQRIVANAVDEKIEE